jgi:type I restriction enzyme S subunit
MSFKKINQLFDFEKGILQSSKCVEGEYDFITAAAEWKTHIEYSHDCEALIFAAAASGSLGRTHYVNGKFISSDLCFILTPKDSKTFPIDLKFYHIIFNLYRNEIVTATKAGTSKEAIGLKVFGEYELPYFDILIQRKVKEEFGLAEALKNNLFDEYSRQLILLENLNQAILQEALQGKLVPQDPKEEPASELLKRIKAEKAKSGKKDKPLPPIKPEEIPFEIPESWLWCRLGEVTNIQRGSSPRPKGDPRYFAKTKTIYNWITISDITNFCENNVLLQTREFLTAEGSKHSRYVGINEFIIAVSGSTTGKCCITGVEGYIYDGLAVAKIIENIIDARYLLNYMMCLYSTINNSKTGASFPNINTDYLNNLVFPLPPLAQQIRINSEIEKQLAKTKQLEEHIIANQEATEQLLKALLHQAFEVGEMEGVNS